MSKRAAAAVVAVAAIMLAAAVVPSTMRGGAIPFRAVRELGVGVLFVVAGLLGWARRPASSIGRLLTVAGLVWLLARALVWAGPIRSSSPSASSLCSSPSPSWRT